MGFKPMAFGLLAGDKPEEALKNAIGDTTVAGKAYYDDEEKRKKEELAAQQAAARKQPAPAAAGMKKGGSVKGWGMARGARAAKYY